MAQDNSSASPSTEEPMTDNAASPSEGQTDAAPALNRAQRRAKGKGGTAASRGAQPQHGGGAAARASGQAGQVRFPRTGHK